MDNFTIAFVEAGGFRSGLTYPDARSLGDAYGTNYTILDNTGVVWYDTRCPGCQVHSMYPHHQGNPSCQSGSLASGGTVTHCTCDACF